MGKNSHIFLLIGLFCIQSLLADIVYLKNGDQVIGKITSQSRETVQIATETEVVKILKSDIRRITFGDVLDEDFLKQQEAEKKKQEAARKRARVRAWLRRQKNRALKKKKAEEQALINEIIAQRGWNLFQRSAVLPGWGHSNAGEEWTGYTYNALFVYFLNDAYNKRQQAQQTRESYDLATLASNSFALGGPNGVLFSYAFDAYQRDRYAASVFAYNDSVWNLIAFYGINLLHAYWSSFYFAGFGDFEDSAEPDEASLLFSAFPDSDGFVGVGWSIRFKF